ncbi:MAG: fasciclin domain-containing protein [Candidatus Obscuribacterales bacterium]|nr:fasciclin domain-containing protein [Candidatus Obscuribacterales bacterium]
MDYLKRTAMSMLALSVLGSGLMAGIELASPQPAVAKKQQVSKKKDIVQTTKADDSFSTLSSALASTGVAKTLHGKGPYTVFAPSDSAFGKMDKARRDEILSDKELLPEVLKYHVVKGKLSSEELAGKRSLKTVQGESLMIDAKDDGGTIVVDGAIVTQPDIDCANGVIHVIDFLLVPERGK